MELKEKYEKAKEFAEFIAFVNPEENKTVQKWLYGKLVLMFSCIEDGSLYWPDELLVSTVALTSTKEEAIEVATAVLRACRIGEASENNESQCIPEVLFSKNDRIMHFSKRVHIVYEKEKNAWEISAGINPKFILPYFYCFLNGKIINVDGCCRFSN